MEPKVAAGVRTVAAVQLVQCCLYLIKPVRWQQRHSWRHHSDRRLKHSCLSVTSHSLINLYPFALDAFAEKASILFVSLAKIWRYICCTYFHISQTQMHPAVILFTCLKMTSNLGKIVYSAVQFFYFVLFYFYMSLGILDRDSC